MKFIVHTLLAGFCSLLSTGLAAQDSLQARISVFIDCRNIYCDFNYIRQQVELVDFSNNRVSADVHALVRAVDNGNGSKNVQLNLIGQHRFANHNQNLEFNTQPNATESEIRQQVVHYLELALVPYLLRTPFAGLIDLSMKLKKQQQEQLQLAQARDPWNYWVFRLSTNGEVNADQVYKSVSLNGNFNVNRTTDKLKLDFNANTGYNKNTFTYTDNGNEVKVDVENSNYSFRQSLIKTLGRHWGVGYEAIVSNNTFSNYKLRLHGKLGVEYSVFPYSDVTSRLLTISYGVYARRHVYYDTTIYLQKQENLWGHIARVNYSLNKKWGTLQCDAAYSNYLHNASLRFLSVNLQTEIRISGGLSFYMYTNGSIVRDQVYLVKGKASEQDILTRRRQLASSYNFYSGVGISYRFGSVLNNFINPTLNNL